MKRDFHVYVAAPYADAALVRDVHSRLGEYDVGYTSQWAVRADGPEDISRYTVEARRNEAYANDAAVKACDVCLVLAREGAGGEMFAEARLAQEWEKPIVWVGRRTLSAWREGVIRVEDLDQAIERIIRIKALYRIWGQKVIQTEELLKAIQAMSEGS